MKKMILSIVTAAIFALNCNDFVFAFSDVDNSDYNFSTAINALYEQNIVEGYPDGSFRPHGSITRAEFATLLYKLKYNSDVETVKAAQCFSDVDSTHWAYKYIYTMLNDGIIYGIENNVFAPNDELTFEQALMMIIRLKGGEILEKAELYNHPMGYLVAASALGLLEGFDYEWDDPRYVPWTSVDENGNKMISYENQYGEISELPTLDELTPIFMKNHILRQEVCLLLYNFLTNN